MVMAVIPYDDTRADWGAVPPKNGGHTYVGPDAKTDVNAHWSGNRTYLTAESPHADCLAKVKSWQGYHMNTQGWRDIGYQILICPHARIIEGSAGGPYTSAACVLNTNTKVTCVQFMVGVDDPPISDAMKDAGVVVYEALCDDTGRTLRRTGHRDYVDTDCPGDVIYEWWTAPTLTGGDMALSDDDKRWILEAIRSGSYRGVWQTDDKMDATDPTDANPKWWPEAVIEDMAQRVKRVEGLIASGVGTGGVTAEQTQAMIDESIADLRVIPAPKPDGA